MTVYPPNIRLPYGVGRRWREKRILDGDLHGPIHEVVIDLDRLDAEKRARALAVWKRIRLHETGNTVEVIGSGILASDLAEDDGDDIPFGDPPHAADPVIDKIGRLPELRQPAKAAIEVIEAYECWIERYMDLAGDAIAAFIEKYAPGTDDETDVKAALVKPDVWRWEIGWRLKDGPVRSCVIDGRTDLELFQRCRGAYQRVAAASVGDNVMSTVVANEVVGAYVELDDKPKRTEELVAAYEDHVGRIAEVTLAYTWTQLRERLGFDVEMRRWAFMLGSERLRMGIEDGYRMVPVYLTERIAQDVPDFYAYLPQKRDGVSWQPRTGPTQAALKWRRGIQAALDEQSPPGMPSAKAEIVWMKAPPMEMCNEDNVYEERYDGQLFHREIPFEAIIVPKWLGRYTLIAGLISEEYTVPDYLLLKYVLHPDGYLLEGLPKPPEGGATIPDCDIPLGSGAADDDIPF